MKFQNFVKFEDIKKENLPFLMKQYCEFKEQYKNFVVLFRIGEFFETYFEDAINFANTCNLTITRRKFKEVEALMAGIPHKKINFYVEKLLKNNFKIVLVEQTDKKDESGNLIRKVSKIYTKGTIFEYEFLNNKENNYLASIYKKDNNYDFCYTDISTGEIFITNGTFEEIDYELSRINPIELLISSNIDENLYEQYRYEILDETFYTENKNSALDGLINYAKSILMDYFPKLDEIVEYKINDYLLINYETRKNLELTKNSFNNQKQGSILSIIDNCQTPMGQRLLLNYLTSPIYNLKEIEKRQNIIKNLIQDEEKINKIEFLLKNIGDTTRLSTKISNQTIKPLEFLTIKESLRILSEINKIINSLKINNEDYSLLDDYFKILDKTLEDDIDKIKDGDFIKNGVDSNLDILKNELTNLLNETKEYEKALQIYTNIQSLKINKKSNSYFIEISNSITNPLNNDFRLIQKLKSTSKYTTEKLINLEEKINSTISKIEEIKKTIFENLKKYSTSMVDIIRNYSKKLAEIDVYYSLSKVAIEYNLACPVFDNDFQIKNSYHLSAKKLWNNFETIDLNFDNKNFILLTGKNGIGKSTLLKTVGMLVILAQIGSFTPSSYLQLPLFDKLFGILTVGDEIINKKSTHQRQMNEISKIINQATKNSLILLDEIGKNTSSKEGSALNFAISKYIIENLNSKTISTTHFLNLKNLYKNLEDKIKFLKLNEKRTIEEGFLDYSFGIEIANAENLPQDIIKEAKSILNLI